MRMRTAGRMMGMLLLFGAAGAFGGLGCGPQSGGESHFADDPGPDRPGMGGESHFADAPEPEEEPHDDDAPGDSDYDSCPEIDVGGELVSCLDLHACKSPRSHVLACVHCNPRFSEPPGLEECPKGAWDDRCHAVEVAGRDAPFDCRELDRCDTGMLAERVACGACDYRYDAPRPVPCGAGDF